jgi:hypothetical protein
VSDGESRSDTPTNIELPIPDDAPVTVFTDGGSPDRRSRPPAPNEEEFTKPALVAIPVRHSKQHPDTEYPVMPGCRAPLTTISGS